MKWKDPGKERAPGRARLIDPLHRNEIKRAGNPRRLVAVRKDLPGPCHFNKEQTPLGDLYDPNPRIHGGCFGV
jgi:hypothetical protein